MSKNTAVLIDPNYMNEDAKQEFHRKPRTDISLERTRYNLGLLSLVGVWIFSYQYLSTTTSSDKFISVLSKNRAYRHMAASTLALIVGLNVSGYTYRF